MRFVFQLLKFWLTYPYKRYRTKQYSRAEAELRESTRRKYDFDKEFGTNTGGLEAKHNYGASNVFVIRKLFDTAEINAEEYTFVDLGAGKGLVNILAAERGFRKNYAIELVYDYCLLMEKNFELAAARIPKAAEIEIECMDALWWVKKYWPNDNVFLFMYCPLYMEELYDSLFENLSTVLEDFEYTVYFGFINPIDRLKERVAELGFDVVGEEGLDLPFLNRVWEAWSLFRRPKRNR